MPDKKIRHQLPIVSDYQYELLKRALCYYRNLSVEFDSNGDIVGDVYMLISIIEEKSELIIKND